MSRIVERTFKFSLFLPLKKGNQLWFLCKFTGADLCKKQARQRRACCAYFALLWGHPAQPPEQLLQPLQPLQPPRARDLSRERTARSTIPASTVSTMMSPMTVTSLKNLHMVDGKTAQVFTFFRLITLAQRQVQKSRQHNGCNDGEDAERGFTGDQTTQLVDDQGYRISEYAL